MNHVLPIAELLVQCPHPMADQRFLVVTHTEQGIGNGDWLVKVFAKCSEHFHGQATLLPETSSFTMFMWGVAFVIVLGIWRTQR